MNFTFAEPLPNVDEDDEDIPDPYACFAADPLSKSESVRDDQKSLDSSGLLDLHYRENYNNINDKWIFEEKEVKILTDEILGRGRFGEVFVGTWRGSQVACKRLIDSSMRREGQSVNINIKEHAGTNIENNKIKTIDQQRMEVWANKLQQKELEVLTTLRHPNLVQFFGICCHPNDQLQPTIIMTELMSYSLYDILEIRKYELDLPEILDITGDMASGLNYLHSCKPMIVHKNLSSKNVLFCGKTAKLADFGLSGQDGAKNFSNRVGKSSSGKTVVGVRPVTAAAMAAIDSSNKAKGLRNNNTSLGVLIFPRSGVNDGTEGPSHFGGQASETESKVTASQEKECENDNGDGHENGGYIDINPEISFPEVVSSSTLSFLAPEILGGTKYKLTEKVDVYSLGMVVLHMVSGELPNMNPIKRDLQLQKATIVAKKVSKMEIAAQKRREIMGVDNRFDDTDLSSLEEITRRQACNPPSKQNMGPVNYVPTSKGAFDGENRVTSKDGVLQHQAIPTYSADPPGTTRGAVLNVLMGKLTELVPISRPSCREVVNLVEEIKYSDRFYPIDRRRPHPKAELSPSIRRWVLQEQQRENYMATLRLHQMRALLQAEGNRWLKEGKVSDFLQQQLDRTSSELMNMANVKNDQEFELRQTIERLRAKTEELQLTKEKHENVTRGLLRDKQRLSERVLELDINFKACVSDYHAAAAALDETAERLAMRDNAVITLGGTLRHKDTEMNHLRARYDALGNENRELEVRLEQALERWKLSHETLEKEQKSFKRISSQSASIVEKNKHLEDERDRLLDLVRRQEGEVLPDDVLRKIAGLEQELLNSAKANENLIGQKQELTLYIDDFKNKVCGLEEELIVSKDLARKRRATIDARDAEIVSMKKDAKLTDEQNIKVLNEYSEREAGLKMKITKLEEWIGSLQKKIVSGDGRSEDGISKVRNIEDVKVLSSPDKGPQQNFNEDGSLEGIDLDAGVQAAQMHFADAVAAKTKTQKDFTQIHASSKDRRQEEKKAAVRAADSMAKARVRQFEIQEDGSSVGFVGIISMLRESVTDVHICWRACRALRPLLLHNGHRTDPNSTSSPKKATNDFKDIAIMQQTDLACVDVLRQFSGIKGESHLEALAKGQAVQLLGVVAFGSDLIRRRAGENGALALIAKVMEYHGVEDEKNLLHCLTTTTNLTHNNQDNRHRFIDAGGLEILSDCMEVHLRSAKVQRQGCWALLTLAGSDETARLVAQGGGSRTLMTLVSALLTHPRDSGVQQFGLWATSNMALAGGDISRRLRKAGLPEVCRIAIENHPKDIEVLRQARHAMGILQVK